MASKRKKNKYSFELTRDLLVIILVPLYFVISGLVKFIVFLVRRFFRFLKGSKEEVIYRAKDFRKKRRPKEFIVKITFLRKIKFGTKVKFLYCFIFIFLLVGGAWVWYVIFKDLPNPSDLANRKVSATTRIYDRNGVLLYQIYKNQNRTVVNLAQVPDSLKLATLASEDAAFYSEHGFSVKGIVRALIANISNRNLAEGGSTITQQLVKNTLLTPEKTFIRKIKELVLAIGVENSFSKDKIFEMYLNEAPYGGTAYGVAAASEQYFNKDVSQLTLAEAALLAGLPKSPTTYSPYGEYPELAFQRQKEVLRLMVENGFITKEQQLEAENEKIRFAANLTNIKAPHFVMYVRQKLVDEYGEAKVEAGGLNVVTTLDYNIQQMAQEVVKKEVEKLKGLHVTNGAAVILNPNTGEILAMVGSKDYFDTVDDGNVNVTTALRPPGSSIKIVNYAYALSHGFTPATIILDAPISFKFSGAKPYSPVNYDGKFVGNVSLRNALAQSRNIPAVKVLASYGVENMIQMGEKMGITTWTEKNTYGLSLTLGGGATKLTELARVYATVANYGKRPPLVSVLGISDNNQNQLVVDCDSGSCQEEEVLDPRVAYQLIDILKDNNARAIEFGRFSSLYVPNYPEVAVKTGTSNDLRDNFTVGFSQDYLTAVWVGNNDNSSMSRIASGITGAAPIWNEIMRNLIGKKPSQSWEIPSGLKQVPCRNVNEFFLNESETKNICNIKEGTASGVIVNN